MGIKPMLGLAMGITPFAIKDTPDWFLETEPHKPAIGPLFAGS
jgi:hypothetical protein